MHLLAHESLPSTHPPHLYLLHPYPHDLDILPPYGHLLPLHRHLQALSVQDLLHLDPLLGRSLMQLQRMATSAALAKHDGGETCPAYLAAQEAVTDLCVTFTVPGRSDLELHPGASSRGAPDVSHWSIPLVHPIGPSRWSIPLVHWPAVQGWQVDVTLRQLLYSPHSLLASCWNPLPNMAGLCCLCLCACACACAHVHVPVRLCLCPCALQRMLAALPVCAIRGG